MMSSCYGRFTLGKNVETLSKLGRLLLWEGGKGKGWLAPSVLQIFSPSLRNDYRLLWDFKPGGDVRFGVLYSPPFSSHTCHGAKCWTWASCWPSFLGLRKGTLNIHTLQMRRVRVNSSKSHSHSHLIRDRCLSHPKEILVTMSRGFLCSLTWCYWLLSW